MPGKWCLLTKVERISGLNYCILFYQLHFILLHSDPLPQQFDPWGYINSFSYSIVFSMAQPMGVTEVTDVKKNDIKQLISPASVLRIHFGLPCQALVSYQLLDTKLSLFPCLHFACFCTYIFYSYLRYHLFFFSLLGP